MQPAVPIILYMLSNIFYAVTIWSITASLLGDGGAAKYWGKVPTLAEEWAFDLFAFGLMFYVAIPSLVMALVMDQPTLKRMCYICCCMIAIVMTGLNHSRSKSAGGLLVDKEHTTGLAVQTVMIILFSMALRNGHVPFAEGASLFSGLTFIPKAVLFFRFILGE